MAPFRNRDRSNRSGRSQVEHNVLEGLPINQYREVEVPIGQNSAENKLADKDALWPELPMPRDSHMLPEHAQQLLRAARSGRVVKPPAPPEEDREDMDEEQEHKEIPQGFTIKKWVKVARHLEDPEPEYLAKRRKGLPSQYVAAVGQVAVAPAPLRETKVKKLDSEGNVTVYKALVPEGQVVEGEIQPSDAAAVIEAAPAAAAPGTVIEGVGVVNADGVVVANTLVEQTPPRRRPPPPKPKKKRAGPGRGKKKVLFVEGQPTEQGTPASGNELPTLQALKREGTSAEPSDGGDTPMADAGDEDEGEDDSEEEEGEDRAHSATPAKSATPSRIPENSEENPVIEAISEPPKASLPPAPIVTGAAELANIAIPPAEASEDTPMPDAPTNPAKDVSSSPDLPLSAISHSRQNSLNQIPTLPTLDAPAPELEPAIIVAAPTDEPVAAPIPVPALEPATVSATVPAVEALERSVEEIPEVPNVEPIADTTVEPVPEPAEEPAVEAIAETSIEPVIEPVLEPVAETIAEPVAELTTEPVAESIAEAVSKLDPEAPLQPVVGSLKEQSVEPLKEPANEAPEPTTAVGSLPESVANGPVESTAGIVVDSISEPVMEPIERPQAPIPEPLAASTIPPSAKSPTPAQEAEKSAKESTPEASNAPPDEDEPDLLGSLEAHLDKDSLAGQ